MLDPMDGCAVFGGQKRDCYWIALCRVVGPWLGPHATYYSGQLCLRLEWRLIDHFMVDHLKGDG